MSSSNPFKMVGSWVGAAILGAIGFFFGGMLTSLCGAFGGTSCLQYVVVGTLIGFSIGFLIGWGIHALIKAGGKKAIIFLLICVLIAIIAIFSMNYANTPKVGDCMDVTKYGEKETPRYCKVIGGVERIGASTFSMNLEESCQAYYYTSCTEGTSHPESCIGSWQWLDSVNNIDAKKVDSSYCE